MALHCCYEKLSGLIIVLVMINANLIQSSPTQDPCTNYCSSGGICYNSGDGDGPKCFCSPRWTGVLCEVPQLEQQADASEQRNAQCNKLQPPFCKNDGICYLDTTGTPKFACHCREPYLGATCQEISECDGYCFNGGTCTLDEVNNKDPVCACPTGFDGIQCKKVITTTVTTASTSTTTSAANGLCTLVGDSYCNSGTCVEVGDNVQCQCPSTATGLQCEIPVGGTVSVPTPGTTPTGPTPTGPTPTGPTPTGPTPSGQTTGTTNPGQTGITCAQAPCRNNGRCYPDGNTYFCLCTSGFTGPNCDNTGK